LTVNGLVWRLSGGFFDFVASPLDCISGKKKAATLAGGLKVRDSSGSLETAKGCNRQPRMMAQFFNGLQRRAVV